MNDVTLTWRNDAPANLVELVVGRCLVDQMDYSSWTELGLLTDTLVRIESHPRLLRSLRFGDEDYAACVYGMVSDLLGEAAEPSAGSWDPRQPPPDLPLRERYPHLETVTEHLDLPAWLALNDQPMLDRLFTTDADATLPDGTVLSAAEATAARLEVGEMRRQVDRIRRDFSDDPESAVGQAKELIETTCRTILGMRGDQDPEDLPKLITRALRHLGVDPAMVRDGAGDEVAAKATKRIFGGMASVLNGAGELRNRRGTGHGRVGTPMVDPGLARLCVGLVLPAVVYLTEVYEATTRPNAAPELIPAPRPLPHSPLEPGMVVAHETFGEGQVCALEGEGSGVVVSVDFGGDTGTKRMLLRYTPLSRSP